ncbi:amidohydrolase family protein [Novosphingobium sediminicola]|uniref:Aminocarboxymuconate-semialdehyde decarboxylase n=1 Tax=Novosphingobium sediminicola TaxID=563162 RepID=A0A7W6G892_9SPHN|nr:amidohydrolase family protein [Novosphingobium sediminicola]MBB3957729.1 aminocarboxymuconate-semialdehyde decarboxylase [Novosphingobium sediminicola]
MSGDHLCACGPERAPIPVMQRGKHLVVDLHCHMNIASAEALVRAEMDNPPNPLAFMSQASMATNARLFASIGRKLNGIDERLEDMDRLGVDVQAISPSPGQYYYFAPDELGRDAARMVNDGIAAAVAQHPDRLVGMGTVPLQNVEMAVQEMRRCVGNLGLRGIEIGTNVAGRELADEAFRPFFAAAEDLGLLVFMHPLGFTHGARLAEHYLDNIIGNPLESSIALSHLIFGGVLEQHSGLKLCVAHGGGYLPAYWGRMDHAFRAREDCRQFIAREPSTYLRQVWLDTLVFDRDQLDSLIRNHGADRLCLGTDYPFDMGEPDPIGFHDHLPDGVKASLLGLNAAELLGLVPKGCSCASD